jgi:hypothetical protein
MVGYGEFGRPEVFIGRVMNYFRFTFTKVKSTELSVHNSGPDLKHFRSTGRRQTGHTHPLDHLWYLGTHYLCPTGLWPDLVPIPWRQNSSHRLTIGASDRWPVLVTHMSHTFIVS